jgi:hypothetical protein
MTGYISRGLVGIALGILLMFSSFHLGVQLAHADTPPTLIAGSAAAGSGSAITSPADQLPDVVAHPAQAFDAEKAAYKLGWPLAVLAAIIMLGRGAGLLGRQFSWLAWIGKGKAAVITAGAVTVSIAAFNSLALGGTWYAALIAAVGVGFALLQPHATLQPAGPSIPGPADLPTSRVIKS